MNAFSNFNLDISVQSRHVKSSGAQLQLTTARHATDLRDELEFFTPTFLVSGNGQTRNLNVN